MKTLAMLATACFALLPFPRAGYAGVNPDNLTCSDGPGPCGQDGGTGEATGSPSGDPAARSLDWHIAVGLARYQKPASFTRFTQSAFERNGNLPTFDGLVSRYFPPNPTQQRQVGLHVSLPGIGAPLFHPSCLFVQSEALFEVLRKPAANGADEYIHQVLTDDAFTLVELLAPPASGWQIRVWKREAAPLVKSGGFYNTSGFLTKAPLTEVTFRRPNGDSGHDRFLYVEKMATGVAGARVTTAFYEQSLDGGGRPLVITIRKFAGDGTTGPLLREETVNFTNRGSRPWDYTIVREIKVAAQAGTTSAGPLSLESRVLEDYDDFSPGANGGEPGMKRLMRRVEGHAIPGQDPRETSYTYVNEPENPYVHGREASSLRTGGHWTITQYLINPANPVSIITEFSGDGGLPPGGLPPPGARRTIQEISGGQSTTSTWQGSTLLSRQKQVLATSGGDTTMTMERQTAGGTWSDRSVTAYHSDGAPAPLTGRLRWRENPDGTAETYSYAITAGRLVTTRHAGPGDRNGILAGSKIVTTHGSGNFPIAEIVTDIASGVVLSSWTTDTAYNGGFDALGRPIKRVHDNDPGDFEITTHACCGIESERARDGTLTQYLRDSLKRIVAETTTTGARVITRTYDYTPVNGLPATKITTTASGVTGSVVLTSVTDHTGRLVSETAPGPMGIPETTTYDHSPNGLVTTRTNPDGGTVITESYPDGKTKSITGTATIHRHYTYTTHNENGGGEKMTVTSGLASSSLLSSVSSYSDLGGRTFKTTRTAPHNQTADTTTIYNALGQVETVASSGQPTVKYLYNAEGEQIATWTDRNGDGEFNDSAVAGVKDSCTTTQSDYLPAASAPAGLGDCQRTITTVRTEANEDKIISTTWQSVDGLRSRQETLGVAGAATATRTKPLNGASTSTQTNPDGTSTVTETVILANGNTQTTSSSYASLPSQSLLSSVSSVSDALGRSIQSTNGRGHVTNYTYHGPGGQTASITQVNAAPGGGNLVTETAYTLTPGSGRLVTTTLPDGTFQYQESNLLGQTTRQWGSQTNPVSYTYDSAGRRATLATYRAPVGANAHTFPSITGDTTTWIHDPSGVLLEKIHADGNKTTYTYDIAGRLATRSWARGVVTTYGYIAGQLTSVDYSDTTPDVTNTYDRLGRKTSSSSLLSSVLQSSVSYSYDPANLSLDTETVTIDPDGPGSLPALTRILDRDQDALGRERSTGILPATNGSAEHSLTYDYDSSGRLSSVTSPAGTFTYAYTPGSSLIASVTGPAHTVTNTWEPNRDVLDIKENRIPSTTPPISSFNYGVNNIGQRTGVQTTGTAFNSTPADWVWGYDALGQVTSADSPNSTFDRAYEYDQIGNRKKSADGALVTTGTTATVYDLNPLNQYSQISVPSVQSVVPIHDQDGNATAYPLPVAPTTNATLAYDGENRLISVTTGTTTVSYIYDSQSRRIARTEFPLPLGEGQGEGAQHTLYLYDAWNCLAEYSLQNSSFTIHNSLSWGFDLSGSLQGAGGVGGLLSVTKHEAQGTTHYFPTYDGNGNVSEYLTASGSIAAHYEYDPFGRTIVESGPNAVDFAYRFSTKPRDAATGLYYYGYRWYDPYTGRWPSRDPMAEAGGSNLYAYCLNQSTILVDDLGLSPRKSSNSSKDDDFDKRRAAALAKEKEYRELPWTMPAGQDHKWGPGLIEEARKLIEDSEWGDPKKMHEEGGWITVNNGVWRIQRWPRDPTSDSRIRPTWPIPEGTIGDIHTHGDGAGPTVMGNVNGKPPEWDQAAFPRLKGGHDAPYEPNHVSWVLQDKERYAKVWWEHQCRSDGTIVRWRLMVKRDLKLPGKVLPSTLTNK